MTHAPQASSTDASPPSTAAPPAAPTADSTEARPATRLLFTALPILLNVAMLVVVGVLNGWDVAGQLVAFMSATFAGLGKFSVFAGALGPKLGELTGLGADVMGDLAGIVGLTATDPLLAYYIAALVTFMDLCTGLIVAFNLDWMYSFPWLGRKLKGMTSSSAEIATAFPWIRRTTFIGCMLFVAFPVSGTGAVGGTILGRLMGFTHARTMLAIAIGAVIGTFSLAFAAAQLGANLTWLGERPEIAAAVLIPFVVFFLWLNWVVRCRVAELRARQEAQQSAGEPA